MRHRHHVEEEKEQKYKQLAKQAGLKAGDDDKAEDLADILDLEPELADPDWTPDQYDACVKVLKYLDKHRKFLSDSRYSALRRAGMKVFGSENIGTKYEGMDPQEYREMKYLERKKADKARRKKEAREADMDAIRRRKRKLEDSMRRQNLIEPPDHKLCVESARIEELHSASSAIPEPEEVKQAAESSSTPSASVAAAEMEGQVENVEDVDPYKLEFKSRTCYICKRHFYDLHHFYTTLCPNCAKKSWMQRMRTTHMDGKIVLITGGRIKIGYCIVRKLLRCGATVICTTRFPRDTVSRFSKEEDFETWKDRLHVYGLDLRDIGGVIRFCDFITHTYPALHVLINNAAQTVRKPPAFYSHLIATEAQSLPPESESCVKRFDPHRGGANALPFLSRNVIENLKQNSNSNSSSSNATASVSNMETDGAESASATTTSTANTANTVNHDHDISVLAEQAKAGNAASSAALAHVALVSGDEVHDTTAFPLNKLDEHSQQLDLRSHNSWKMPLAQVPVVEMVECQAVNSIAPFILTGQLRPLMARSDGNKYVVQVSAMEGKFYRWKSTNHPHTNMAKAALNMMVRTSAREFADDNIYMTAVDTGWVTDENPVASESAYETRRDTPIDSEEGAARVLHPIFDGFDGIKQHFGVFLKDYEQTEW